MEDPNLPPADSGPSHSSTEVPVLQQLVSLDQFMANRPDDAWERKAYIAYWNLLKAHALLNPAKKEIVKANMLESSDLIKKYHFFPPLSNMLNAVYQALLGPRPGDNLRSITADFIVDDHQWKHYSNGDKEWGLFNCSWQDVHKIILHGAKLILAARAIQIDSGAIISNQVMDGFVQFNVNVGTPGNFVSTGVSLIKIQISRDSKTVSGHGYPVPGKGGSDYPTVNAILADALIEILSPDNNEMRKKKKG